MSKHFRTIAYLEGVSFILLLGIAMPLKYLGGYPQAVKLAGWMHGLLFMLYIYAAVQLAAEAKWTMKRLGVVFFAAVFPFGPFLLDRHPSFAKK